MRHTTSCLFLLLLALGAAFTPGCDVTAPSAPEDEATVFTRAQFILEPADGTPNVTRNVRGTTGLRQGDPLEIDTLHLKREMRYAGAVLLYDQHGASMAERIKRDAEAYLFSFDVVNLVGVSVQVADRESDYGANRQGEDMPLGITYNVEVATSARVADPDAPAGIRVRLGYFGNRPKDSQMTNVEPLIDFLVPVSLLRAGPADPGAPEPITDVTLQFDTFSMGTGNPNGLNDGSRLSMTVRLNAGRTYEGSIRMMTATGRDVTAEVLAERDFHQFFFTPLDALADVLTIEPVDVDYLGFPVGLQFRITVAPGAALATPGELRFQLGHYDPARGESKYGGAPAGRTDMDFLLPVEID